MHELSIAMNIVEIVEEHAGGVDGKEVSEVELEIGKSSGVVIEALQFALEEAVKSSVMAGANIRIKEIPSLCRCVACSHEFEPEDIITPCPRCGHVYSDIIEGQEMKIKAIRF
jgi:hydrogenase nickel incorporation protein HypA/HybF